MTDLSFRRYVLRTDERVQAGIIFDASKDPVQIVHISYDVRKLLSYCDMLNDEGENHA